ncbi:hypothetical protein [Nocardiopsis kunsanensis]|uniref:hypothetical protein n=1 Tax=Nocardiopsis kunsanensis TaxID=141693 RepID=UPI000349F465|nr:hypothetical protein [Nocardiopsis kunsanensis]
MTVVPTMYDRFADEEVTVDMLRDLGRTGPGGLLIADLRRAAYEVTHARDLDMVNRGLLPIYGHDDLLHDLDCYDRDWEETADAVTDTTWDQLDHWATFSRAMSPLARALRRDMTVCGMDLTRRPVLNYAPDGTRLVQDTFVLRTNPRITFISRSGQQGPASLLASLDMYDRGHYVTTWTQLVTHEASPKFVREAPLEAERHMKNTCP